MRAVVVQAAGPLSGAVVAPASKSVTNRLLVLAALAEGESRLGGPLRSDDSAAMRDLVTALGAQVRDEGADWVVRGTGGALLSPERPLECRLSGTTLRFGTALAALAPGPVTVDGLPPLRRRPVGALVEALRGLGAGAVDGAGFPPVLLDGGGLDGGEVTVDVRRSSQFASAVMLVAPYARTPVSVTLGGASASGYVELTAAAMAQWGAVLQRVHGRVLAAGEADRWEVEPGRYEAREVVVAADASAAAHLYALAVATAGRVTVTNAATGAAQPDAAILEVLARFGATVEGEGASVSVSGPAVLRPVPEGLDLEAMPDQVTTVAVLAALAPGATEIHGVAVARGHETDRLAALATELGKVGVRVEEFEGALVVHGGTARGGATLETHDDHRLAMAFAALAARVGDVAIADPGCVAKTYSAFWEDLESLGGRLDPT